MSANNFSISLLKAVLSFLGMEDDDIEEIVDEQVEEVIIDENVEEEILDEKIEEDNQDTADEYQDVFESDDEENMSDARNPGFPLNFPYFLHYLKQLVLYSLNYHYC
jgi:hypothetical protein